MKRELIPVTEPPRWDAALEEVGEHDVYHASAFHSFASATDGGSAYLFVFRRDAASAAVPFLVKPVADVAGLEGQPHVDATSVEGYPGVVSSATADSSVPEGFRQAFQEGFSEALHELGVTALFGRQNPFLSTEWLLDGVAETPEVGSTVAVDCTRSDEGHEAQMSSHHRRNLRKARRGGLQVERDEAFRRLPDFIEMYGQTMDRVGAADRYHLPDRYFHQLTDALGERVWLVLATLDGQPVSGALFLTRGSVVHYHLGGTAEVSRNLGAPHLLFDGVRSWCRDEGRCWLHLGGGVGAAEDSLFRFKSGFSKARFPYHVVKWVVDETATEHLSSRRHEWLTERGLEASKRFFPPYRAPAVPPAAG